MKKPKTDRRKQPRQHRSHVTVDAVVEATAQVLRERGYRGATLRQIAARAGVGVGSIYQYFPTKEALLAAVMERHLEEVATLVATAVADPKPASLRGRVAALVSGAVKAHQADPALHRVLVEELPRVGRLHLHTQTLQRLEGLVEGLLEAHSHEIRDGCRPLMAAVLVSAVDAAVHTVVLDRPGLNPEALTAEVVHLVQMYLRPSGSPS